MKKIGLLFSLGFVMLMSCTSDDAPDYNPIEQLAADIALIESFLADNNLQAEQDDSGLYFNITRPGSGANPTGGDIVTLDYKLFNFDGQLLDTSIEQAARDAGIFVEGRPYEDFEFTIGTGQVIPGFDRAVRLLVPDSDGTFYLPSVLAYRNIGSGSIGPNENIIFEITLHTIN